MGKKKREHVVFDKMLVPKKAVPLKTINAPLQINTGKSNLKHK